MNNVRNLLTGSLVYIACIVLLSLACNVSSGLPVADVIGQWLYFDKSALVVAGCLLMAGLMMEKRYFLFIPVSWVLVMLGGIEAVWGLRQLYGYAVSNHSLYVLTGSFFNLGLPSITGMGLFEPFPVSADRLFFQSGALFRLFGHDTSGLSASMADQEGGDSLL